MKTLPLLLFLTACAVADNEQAGFFWRNNQTVHARTEDGIPDASKVAFSHRVQTDVNRWRSALESVGCPPPFTFVEGDGDDDNPMGTVALVSNIHWRVPEAVGLWSDGVVYIRAEGDGTLDTYADDPGWTPGLHEIGHAIGLQHTDPADGPSIMGPSGYTVTDFSNPIPQRDIYAAACVLGCGPCT